jgi:hypothetical protein
MSRHRQPIMQHSSLTQQNIRTPTQVTPTELQLVSLPQDVPVPTLLVHRRAADTRCCEQRPCWPAGPDTPLWCVCWGFCPAIYAPSHVLCPDLTRVLAVVQGVREFAAAAASEIKLVRKGRGKQTEAAASALCYPLHVGRFIRQPT